MNQPIPYYDVIILGAGAAGLMCAMEAGKRGRSVLLLDKAAAAGEKIRISGGGRCNFTNIHTGPGNYLSQNPHFCVSALKRYSPADFIALVEQHRIAFHEKTLGQLFCDGSSRQIITMLLDECEAAGVMLQLQTEIRAIRKSDYFQLESAQGEYWQCAALVIATGGPSISKMGASGYGYEIAQQFGLDVITPRPALVPFTLNEATLAALKPLAGVAFDADVTCHKQSFREAALITHRGFSGPAILQISSYWQDGDKVTINAAPGRDGLALLKEWRKATPKQDLRTALTQLLPKKLAHYLADHNGLSGELANCSNATLEKAAAAVHSWQVEPDGTEGYRTAEVTLGGVNTAELSSKDFQAKNVPGLYFIGEVVDVTGHLGGYNFQWAWASGHAAGQAIN